MDMHMMNAFSLLKGEGEASSPDNGMDDDHDDYDDITIMIMLLLMYIVNTKAA